MKINCNVAQDLMQPYVEDILSADSRELLMKHLEGCEACRAKLDEIRGINRELDGTAGCEPGAVSHADTAEKTKEVATFRQFKKWIDMRRAVAIIITIAVVITGCIGVAYYIGEYQTYIPYEESGIQVSPNGDIYTKAAYQMNCTDLIMKDRDSEGVNHVMFVYLTSSIRSRRFEKPGEMSIVANPIIEEEVWKEENDGVPVENHVVAVYYASPKFLKSLKGFNINRSLLMDPDAQLTEEERQALLDQVCADSVLLWEKG